MKLSRTTLSWALYDWANSAFAVIVLTGFFPIFFRDYWALGRASEEVTLLLGAGNSLASLIIVLIAPALGAIADQGGYKKLFLAVMALIGALLTVALSIIPAQSSLWALGLFVLASISWMSANVFYDAMLIDITHPASFDRISALGYSLGYLGSGLLFSLCIWLTLSPQTFGLANSVSGIRVSFILTGLWWIFFTLPLLFYLETKPVPHRQSILFYTRAGFKQLIDTFHHILRYRNIFVFLLAYWLYIDGVDTVIRMAVDYGKALGFGTSQLISALLITQFIGFPAALGFAWLAGKTGTRNGILIGLTGYVVLTVWASQMQATWEFYALAIAVGLIQGGVQALSRSLYAQLIPPSRSAEFFGFYNMMGKFAAILGPLMVGWVGYQLHNPRLGLLSLLILFFAGAGMLLLVRKPNTA